MSHIIFLTPATQLPANLTGLIAECKSALLSYLRVRIVDEQLRPSEDNKTFTSKYQNWLLQPSPKIETITAGAEVLKFEGTDYDVNYEGGSVEFGSAVTDPVKADFNYFPFSEDQLSDAAGHSLEEISVLIHRDIDENNIHKDYRGAICKRLYTNLLKSLLLEAKDFFTVSVGGRNIDKSNVVAQIQAIIDENEKQLSAELDALRNFNKTNRVLPTFPVTKQIKSDAEIS